MLTAKGLISAVAPQKMHVLKAQICLRMMLVDSTTTTKKTGLLRLPVVRIDCLASWYVGKPPEVRCVPFSTVIKQKQGFLVQKSSNFEFCACPSKNVNHEPTGEWFTCFSSVLPTSLQIVYCAGKPIERVVYRFYQLTMEKLGQVLWT